MAFSDYLIGFSDTSKTNIVIPTKTSDVSTSIRLFGKGFEDYGEVFQENIIHILENFSHSVPPSNALSGQLWFDSINKRLNVFYNSGWQKLSQQIYVSSSAPTSPFTGDLWFDTANDRLNTWNGLQWSSSVSLQAFDAHVADLNLHITLNERQILNRLVGTTITTAQLVKIQTLTDNAQTQIDNKFDKSGGPLSGFGFVHSEPEVAMHFANKGYVDAQIAQYFYALDLGRIIYRDVHKYTVFTSPGLNVLALPHQGTGEFDYSDIANFITLVFVNGEKLPSSLYTHTNASGDHALDFGSISFVADLEISVVRIKKRPGDTLGALYETYESYNLYNVANSTTTYIDVPKPVATNGSRFRTMVFINGIHQQIGSAWSYLSPTHIRIDIGVLPAYMYPAELHVDIIVFEYDGSGPTYVSNIEYETCAVSTPNSTVVTLGQSYDYDQNDPLNPHNDAVMVFIGGVYQGKYSYFENTGTSIKLSEPIHPSTLFEIYKFKIV